jgi:uncharacterized protein YdhG (YjbR/CyaY superfamily)
MRPLGARAVREEVRTTENAAAPSIALRLDRISRDEAIARSPKYQSMAYAPAIAVAI